MTKKYKLIKEYPGSPKLGICVDEVIDYDKELNSYKNYPEFWQEVKKPNFEILSFKSKNVDRFWLLKKNGKYSQSSSTNEWELNDFLILNEEVIYSVKRLSDGEIFTIGDYINNKQFGGNGHIIRFNLYNLNYEWISMDISYDIIDNDSDDSQCDLDQATKVIKKQPLFTTEDGIEIFGGDIYFSVHYSKFCGVGANGEIYPTSDSCSSCGHWIPFSTKQKAEEYIIMNKPCLSLKDVLLSIARQTRVTQKITNELKRIIKARI